MNPKSSLVCLAMLCHSALSLAQSASTLMGARSHAMGYASSCLRDEWSLFNNVAGLSSVTNVVAAAASEITGSAEGLNRTAATLTIPLKTGVTGIGAFRFGDPLYNEQIVTAGYSNQFGIASLGVKINYVQYNAEGFGRSGVISVGFGGIAQLTPSLTIGAYITNLNQPKINEEDQEYLPTILSVGLGFAVTEKFFFTTELEKDINYDVRWKTGIEYEFYKKFFARTGYSINPDMMFFGLGFHWLQFKAGYALSHHQLLGITHQASLSYQLNQK